MAYKKSTSMCPDCYLVDGIDTPMDIRPGKTLQCSKGHTWAGNDRVSDMEIYDQRQAMARHKRDQIAKSDDPEADKPTGPLVTAVVASNTGDEIVIDKESRARISSLVGEFTDGSSLFGSIFSLSQDITNLQDQLAAANNALLKAASASGGAKDGSGMAKQSAGDMAVTIVIPEIHVVPLREIAEASGCDIPVLVNSVVSSGLDNGWFY